MSKINLDFENKKLKLVKWQYLSHYNVLIAPVVLYVLISDKFKFDLYLLITVILIIIFYLIQNQLLKFKEYKINCSHDNLVGAMSRSAKSLDWKIESTDKILFAFDNDNLEFRYKAGFLIIVTKTEEGFLFNSISDPREIAAPFFKPLFRLNIEVFKKHLIDVIKGIEYNEQFQYLSKEWTLKKILIRLFLYPLSLGLIFLFCYLLKSNESISSTGFIAISISSIVSIVYLFYDIKGIMQNS